MFEYLNKSLIFQVEIFNPLVYPLGIFRLLEYLKYHNISTPFVPPVNNLSIHGLHPHTTRSVATPGKGQDWSIDMGIEFLAI